MVREDFYEIFTENDDFRIRGTFYASGQFIKVRIRFQGKQRPGLNIKNIEELRSLVEVIDDFLTEAELAEFVRE